MSVATGAPVMLCAKLVGTLQQKKEKSTRTRVVCVPLWFFMSGSVKSDFG